MPKPKPSKEWLDLFDSNFQTLNRAFVNGDVALMQCLDTRTNKSVAAICAVGKKGKEGEDSEEIGFTPFAVMLTGNPYEYLLPPNPDHPEEFAPRESLSERKPDVKDLAARIKQRPANFFSLPAKEQWAIDKKLGLLDYTEDDILRAEAILIGPIYTEDQV